MQSTSRRRRDQWIHTLISGSSGQGLQLHTQAKKEENRFLRYCKGKERLESKHERKIKHKYVYEIRSQMYLK